MYRTLCMCTKSNNNKRNSDKQTKLKNVKNVKKTNWRSRSRHSRRTIKPQKTIYTYILCTYMDVYNYIDICLQQQELKKKQQLKQKQKSRPNNYNNRKKVTNLISMSLLFLLFLLLFWVRPSTVMSCIPKETCYHTYTSSGACETPVVMTIMSIDCRSI